MNHRRNSSEQQQRQHYRRHHHHHRQHQPTKQEIHILMDKNTSQFQVSIKSDGPIDTTVVVDSAVLTNNSSSSSSSPSSPLPIPLIPIITGLPQSPRSIYDNITKDMNIKKAELSEHFQ